MKILLFLLIPFLSFAQSDTQMFIDSHGIRMYSGDSLIYRVEMPGYVTHRLSALIEAQGKLQDKRKPKKKRAPNGGRLFPQQGGRP